MLSPFSLSAVWSACCCYCKTLNWKRNDRRERERKHFQHILSVRSVRCHLVKGVNFAVDANVLLVGIVCTGTNKPEFIAYNNLCNILNLDLNGVCLNEPVIRINDDHLMLLSCHMKCNGRKIDVQFSCHTHN